jgi:hypothetical protein
MTSQNTTLDLAADLGIASIHTGFTLWHRLPMLAASCTRQGKVQHAIEMDRMVTEKVTAIIDGVIGIQRELTRLAVAAMTGRLDFEDMPHISASVAAAGLNPAFRTVKANSRRLSCRA